MHLARDLHVGKKVFWPWLCVFYNYNDIIAGTSVLANCSDCFVYYIINFSVRHSAVIISHGDLTCVMLYLLSSFVSRTQKERNIACNCSVQLRHQN